MQELGGGLVMLGGDQAFGLGGYYKTTIEEILPVRSDFEKEKEKPSLAMVLVIDKSGSMGGVKIEMAAVIEGRRRFHGLLLGVEGAAARVRRDDAAPGEASEVLLPIDEMSEARIVLSDDVIAQSLRRGKTEQREVRWQRAPHPMHRPNSIEPAAAHGRPAAHHEGE